MLDWLRYDGNGNIIKTVDFKSVTHYYFYDELNRMIEHGPNATITTNTEKYTWTCCQRMTAYVDAQGTASLSYDDLGRLTSHTDSNGNTVAYEYDEMSRVNKITPAQGTNYRTQYTYKENGSLLQVKAYDGGSAADVDYTYNTTSGKLTSRAFPTVTAAYIKTAYSYDSAGRLEYETITKESGANPLYRFNYAYSYIAASSGGGNEILRTEQVDSSGWVNDNKVNYRWDALGRMTFEQRHDWVTGSWVAKYDVNQVYDKNGNRTARSL